jgi:8-oxo-dGTP pyrophosphatase MutT (NUDIX family)
VAEQQITCVDIYGKKHQVPVSELRWRPSAYGVVIRGDKVLLCKHFKKHNLPGGSINLGETPEAAVIREIKEETGIDAANPRLLGMENDFFRMSHSDGSCSQSLLLYYVCDYVGGQLSTDGFDEEEQQYAELAEWTPLKLLDTLQVTSSKDYRKYIKQAAAEAAAS